MNRINSQNLEPGPYKDEHGFEVVVIDIITHGWNSSAGLQEALLEPLVVGRQLMRTEERYVWPLAVFKERFKAIV